MSPKHTLPSGKSILVVIAAVATVGLVACGSDSTTTVVESTPAPETVTQVAAPPPKQAAAPGANASSSAQATRQEPPDVTGLSLPEARKLLSAAGYRVDPENTDTTFGIVVESNYTICEQDEPRGVVVHVLAQKYGC